MKNNGKNITLKLIILLLIFIGLLLLFGIIVFRIFSDRQLDDVSPLISCEQNLLDKSDVLMVIPIFENQSIAQNKSWCREILGLNKTLGMHGVYHSYQEFYFLRDESYIREGMAEFRKCFGFYPSLFEAPQVALSSENAALLKNLNITIAGYVFNLFHKVYHCSDSGAYGNGFVDLI